MNLYQTFSDIANAIRSKTGAVTSMTPLQMPGEIANISSGVDPNDYKILVNEGSGYVESNVLKAEVGSSRDTSLINSFNYPVIIGNNVTSCSNMFLNASVFNQPVTIPDNVTNCVSMFNNAFAFNQPVIIPNNVINCYDMFRNSSAFNQPITIPDNVTDCQYMFFNAFAFNQPVIIGNNVMNCQYMFLNAFAFNQPVIIPNNVINCVSMFHNCQNMMSNIYIRQTSSLNVKNMLRLKNNAKQINLFCNNILILNKTTSTTSLVGNTIAWTSMINGYYNATYNICIYNNCPY